MAMDLVSWTIAPFAALYEGTSPDPKNEYILPMLMIFPPLLLTIDRAASFERRKTALSWVSMTLSNLQVFPATHRRSTTHCRHCLPECQCHRVRARPGSVRAPIRRDWLHPPSPRPPQRRLLSIQKAPAGSFRRFVQTPRRQRLLGPIRAQCHGQFRHCHQSPQPPGRLGQIMQVFSSSSPFSNVWSGADLLRSIQVSVRG